MIYALEDQDVRCLAADPHRPGTFFAGTQGAGLFRSPDGGVSWAPAGLERRVVKALATSPAEPGLVLAGTKPALVFASGDGGDTWRELEGFRRIRGRRLWFSPAKPPYTVGFVQGLAVSPTDPRLILAGIEFGAVVRSSDAGRTWSGHRRGALRDCHSLTAHTSDGRWFYEGGGTGGGAAFSRDRGRTWTQVGRGMDRHYGWAAAADPERPEVWYVSVAPSPWKAHAPGKAQAHIYRLDGGGSWRKLGGGLPDPITEMPYDLVTDPSDPGTVYAGLGDGQVWRSPGCGQGWERLPLRFQGLRRLLLA